MQSLARAFGDGYAGLVVIALMISASVCLQIKRRGRLVVRSFLL